MNIRPLDPEDRAYALFSWRESAKKAPGLDRVPWGYYKDSIAGDFESLLRSESTVVLGAYTHEDQLAGWIAMTQGKRVHTLHWVYVKHELGDKHMRRRGVMLALLEAAELGSRFIYTLRGRKLPKEQRGPDNHKSLDEALVVALRDRGIVATYVPLKEWLK